MSFLSPLGFEAGGQQVNANSDTYSSMPSIYNTPQIDEGFIKSDAVPGSPIWLYDTWKGIFGSVFNRETTEEQKPAVEKNQTTNNNLVNAVPEDKTVLYLLLAVGAYGLYKVFRG